MARVQGMKLNNTKRPAPSVLQPAAKQNLPTTTSPRLRQPARALDGFDDGSLRPSARQNPLTTGSRRIDSFELTGPALPAGSPVGKKNAPQDETKTLDVFDKNAELSNLLNPFQDTIVPNGLPGRASPEELLAAATSIPTEGDGKNSSSRTSQQSDGGLEALGGLVTLLGATAQTGAGKVPLSVLAGAGTAGEVASGLGAVLGAGVLGYKVGEALDGALTSTLGKSLGEWVYDKVTTEPKDTTPPAGGQCGGDETPDPTTDAPRGPGSPDFAPEKPLPTTAQLEEARTRQVSQPGEGRAQPSRFTVNRKDLLAGGLAHHTDGRTQPLNDGQPSGGVSGPLTTTNPGNVDPLEADGTPSPDRPRPND